MEMKPADFRSIDDSAVNKPLRRQGAADMTFDHLTDAFTTRWSGL